MAARLQVRYHVGVAHHTGQGLEDRQRWRSQGDDTGPGLERWIRGGERINRNNHPIRAGDVIGTHNGTIYNADYLFRRFKLPRFAQVDSELLFCLAARAARNGRMDVEWFKERLRRCLAR